MIGWAIFAGYMIVYLFVFRKVVWVVAEDSRSFYTGRIETGDWSFAVICAAFATIFWPIIVPLYMSRNYMHLVASPPKHIRQELELKEREERIKQLERELGIK